MAGSRSWQASGSGCERLAGGSETGIREASGKRAFDNASFFRVLGVFHFKQRFFDGDRSSGNRFSQQR